MPDCGTVHAVLDEELAFANELADRAAEIGLRWFRGADLRVHRKADLTPVTQADVEIEAMVRHMVGERFPGDPVLGEEEGGRDGGGRVWIVDPIDATKNFARGIQVWGTLIALRVEGGLSLGVVSAPALAERYEAVRGGGAWLNGQRIHVSDVATITESEVLYAGMKTWLSEPRNEGLLGTIRDAARTRAFGDFWGHMLVARGAAEVMVEPELRVWDYAAAQVVTEEAGGRVTTMDGAPTYDGGSVLTTNGVVHDEVLARLAR